VSEESTFNPTGQSGTEHEVASRIFDNLDGILAGESEEQEAPGEPEAPEAGSDERTEEDESFDAEAADALKGDEPEDDESEDELEGEETSDEDEDEDSEPEEDDEPAEQSEEPDIFTVRVDGEEMEVSLDELLAGYSRTESWTRKSQALADERRAFESEASTVQAQREEYGNKLLALEEHFAQAVPKEPAQDAPDSEWIKYQRAMSQLEAVQAEKAKVYQEWQSEQTRLNAQIVEVETAELLEKVPEWKDNEVRTAGLKSLFTFATQTLGFDAETVKDVRDHRLILLLKLAAEGYELQGTKETVRSKTKKAKTLKPGNRPSAKTKARAKQRATRKKGREALRESGSHRDAARLFEDSGMIDDLL
jgi:hypothetical protein